LHFLSNKFIYLSKTGQDININDKIVKQSIVVKLLNIVFFFLQANGIIARRHGIVEKSKKSNKKADLLAMTAEMLAQKNVESVLFEGKKIVESTNYDKLETFSGELIKEQERRKTSILPPVMLKQNSPSPRTSSATSLSTSSSY